MPPARNAPLRFQPIAPPPKAGDSRRCWLELAAVIAAGGLYSVISYSGARQTRELGVRIALGAGRRNRRLGMDAACA
jgi:hypothetical protein